MATQQSITGVAGLTSLTWYPQPPVEWGSAGGAVATITVGTATGENGTGGGVNGAVADKATTTDGNGSGLVVDLTIAGNVCTAIAVDALAASDGDGYRIGDAVTIALADSGTTTDVVGYVASLEYEN
jgi:hypothetical protein|tara:strand:+ start:85 stop:465 length:381 start_codon:yes stop_codon:yes gene_type:complete